MIQKMGEKQKDYDNNKTIFTQEIDDLIYLLYCSVNEIVPDIGRINKIDFDAVLDLALFHSVATTISFAIERAIELPYKFDQIKKKTIRKLALFDIERSKIITCFNKEKIWYLPLKGIVLMGFYPRFGMRDMSDNDILCDSSRMFDIQRILQNLGYTKENDVNPIHDCYIKTPLVFEFHKSLFSELELKHFADYYVDIKDKLIHNKNSLEYCFTPEDFYIYMTAHEYKHYNYGGTGIRSLLDTYVFLKCHAEHLDWNYINIEIASLSLTEFEKMNRELALKVFSKTTMDDDEKKLFMYFVSSGVHGTEEHLWKNRLSQTLSGDDSAKSKRNYLFDRVFIHGETLKNYYPFVYRHKILLPGLYIYRFIKAIFIKPKKIWTEYKRVKHFKYTN